MSFIPGTILVRWWRVPIQAFLPLLKLKIKRNGRLCLLMAFYEVCSDIL